MVEVWDYSKLTNFKTNTDEGIVEESLEKSAQASFTVSNILLMNPILSVSLGEGLPSHSPRSGTTLALPAGARTV